MKDGENNHNLPFGTPGGYFGQSAERIMQRLEWQRELQAYPTLAAAGNKSPFDIPPGYFAGREVRLEMIPYPSFPARQNDVFATPPGYFAGGNVGDADANFPALGAAGRHNRFITPDGYFEKNEARLRKSLQPRARIIALFSVRTVSAIAAMLVITCGIWLYRIAFQPSSADCGTVACLDKSEILQSKQIETVETEELYDVVDAEKLEKILKGENGRKDADTSESDYDPLDEI